MDLWKQKTLGCSSSSLDNDWSGSKAQRDESSFERGGEYGLNERGVNCVLKSLRRKTGLARLSHRAFSKKSGVLINIIFS